MRKKSLISLLFILVISKALCAQIMLKEVSLGEKVERSSIVLEGKVISKKSFWDVNHKKIYTVNTIEVYKVFKGEPLTTIEIITPGGTVDLEAQIVTPSLKLKKGDTGLFTLYESNITLDSKEVSVNRQFESYGSLQGFYKYDVDRDVAFNPFQVKHGISSKFYNEIKSHTKTEYSELSGFNTQSKSTSSSKSSFLVGLTDFSPSTSTAGTKSILTITGSNFGATQGTVSFSNADDAGINFVDALDSQVLSWNNSEITVEIPSEAGTGKVRVKDNTGSTVTSSSNLTIMYAQANIVSDNLSAGIDVAYPTQLINANGSGGYTWNITTDFENILGAKEAFVRAMETWSCETQINWDLSETSAGPSVVNQHKSVSDDKNVIAFDNSASLELAEDLPDTVLGRRTSYYSACYVVNNGVTSLEWYIREFDIIFDDEAVWNFDSTTPSASEFDFESVAVHELGHCRQLDHIIDTDNVMHFSIAKGEVLRSLSSDNVAVANVVQSRSTGSTVCSQLSMTNYSGSCSLGIEEDELNDGISIYPNPTNGKFHIVNEAFINLEKVVVYDLSGRLISEYKVLNASRNKTINLNNISKGIYLVNIHSDKTFITKKMMVQ
jgi:hypothetical protein